MHFNRKEIMDKLTFTLVIIVVVFLLGCNTSDIKLQTFSNETIDSVNSIFLRSNQLFTDYGYIRPAKAIGKKIFSNLDNEVKYNDIFKKIYTRTYEDNKEINGNSIQTFRFLFSHYLNYENDSTELKFDRSNLGNKDNPIFTAYSLLVGSGIDSRQIGDPAYIKLLAESFGIEPFYVRCAVHAWLKYGVSSILFETTEMIKNSVANFNGEEETFLVQILVPFMQIVLTGRKIESNIETQILSQFKKIYRSGNELKEFIDTYRKTMNSNAMHVKYLNNLNSILKKHGYYMTASDNDCSAYKIMRSSEKLSLINGSRILMLKKISIGLTSAFYGYVRVQEKDIIILPENLDEEALKISDYVNKGSEYSFYNNSANKVWKSIGLNMSTSKADSIRNSFVNREFKGKNYEEIRRALEVSTIIHEIKHIWDDVKDPRNKRIWNMDAEFSAYMAQAILSDFSYAKVFSHIAAQENFYLSSIQNEDVCAQVGPVVKDLWELILSQKDDILNEKVLKLKLEKIYKNFKTMDGYKLPSIELYRKELPAIITMTDHEGEKNNLVIKK